MTPFSAPVGWLIIDWDYVALNIPTDDIWCYYLSGASLVTYLDNYGWTIVEQVDDLGWALCIAPSSSLVYLRTQYSGDNSLIHYWLAWLLDDYSDTTRYYWVAPVLYTGDTVEVSLSKIVDIMSWSRVAISGHTSTIYTTDYSSFSTSAYWSWPFYILLIASAFVGVVYFIRNWFK